MALCSTHPGLILGPRFAKLSESVKQVSDFLNEATPVTSKVDSASSTSRTSPAARCSPWRRVRAGERYILSGENVTVKQLFDLLEELTGLKAPTIKAPVPVVRALAAIMELASKITGTKPKLDRSQVDEFAGNYGYFDSGKAKRDLGYSFLSARDTLRRTVAWLVDKGFVNERRRSAMKLHPSLANAY